MPPQRATGIVAERFPDTVTLSFTRLCPSPGWNIANRRNDHSILTSTDTSRFVCLYSQSREKDVTTVLGSRHRLLLFFQRVLGVEGVLLALCLLLLSTLVLPRRAR